MHQVLPLCCAGPEEGGMPNYYILASSRQQVDSWKQEEWLCTLLLALQSAGFDSYHCSLLYDLSPAPDLISVLWIPKPPSTLWKNISYYQFAISSLSMSLNTVLQQVRENFARIQACISELRSLPREGCFPQGGNGVVQAVQDGLQQFKQYSRHTAAGGSTNSSIEVRKCWESSESHPPDLPLVSTLRPMGGRE